MAELAEVGSHLGFIEAVGDASGDSCKLDGS